MKATWHAHTMTAPDESFSIDCFAVSLHHEGRSKRILAGDARECRAVCSILNSVLEEDRDALARSIRTIFSIMGDEPIFDPDAIDAPDPAST